MLNNLSGFSMKTFIKSDLFPVSIIAFVNLILHLLSLQGFGIFRDELYYLACANHPAAGYVDHPPLGMWLLKCYTLIMGDSVTAMRILPVLGGSIWIFLTGLLAKKLGGGKFAMFLSAFTAFATLGNHVLFSYYSMNFWDMLLWMASFFILIRIFRNDRPNDWIPFGILVGVGLMNKISPLFLLAGLGVGLLLTSQRRQLLKPQFWIGMAMAVVLFSPYIIWNALHGWPHLEFIANAKAYKMAAISPLEFLIKQILYNNPANLVIWLGGLFFLFFHPKGKPFRVFGWLFLFLYILFTVQQAKDYYLAAAYPLLFAGGAVLYEFIFSKKTIQWIGSFQIAATSIAMFVLLPVVLPILSVDQTIQHLRRTGLDKVSGSENHKLSALPQHYADRFGWEELAVTFSDVYQMLLEEEKKSCIIFVRNYGEAGTVDYFGKNYGLPSATCTHNNYWLWGPPEWDGKTAIIYGYNQNLEENLEDLHRRFEQVTYVTTFQNKYCMPYESNRPVFICRNATFNIRDLWKEDKCFN